VGWIWNRLRGQNLAPGVHRDKSGGMEFRTTTRLKKGLFLFLGSDAERGPASESGRGLLGIFLRKQTTLQWVHGTEPSSPPPSEKLLGVLKKDRLTKEKSDVFLPYDSNFRIVMSIFIEIKII
jgi:hypothetical protein